MHSECSESSDVDTDVSGSTSVCNPTCCQWLVLHAILSCQFAGSPFFYPPNNHYPYPSPNPGPLFPFNTFPPSKWGFPASHFPTKSPNTSNLNAPVQVLDDLKAWYEKHSLSQQDHEGLKKLGFCVREMEALTALELSTWVWEGIPPLRRAHILEICAVEKTTVI